MQKESVPGIKVGEDPFQVLSWTTMGYDYILKDYPSQHLFLDCIGAASRVKAAKARECDHAANQGVATH